MYYKARRQVRYERLLQAHLLPVEARTLSRVSFRVPYMRLLANARSREYNDFIAQGGAVEDWPKHIRKQYIDREWKRAGERWIPKVIFRMLKAYEHDYKYKHKQYESPWEKRKTRTRDIGDKLDRTVARRQSRYELGYDKYPTGRAYHR